MKLLNYDTRYLIMQNVRTVTKEIPDSYTQCQYRILCRVIRQKKVTEAFFKYLLLQLYDLSDWKQLNYQQMYELIHILNHWNYQNRGK